MRDLLHQRLQAKLEALKQEGLARALPAIGRRRGARYELDGRWVTGFCSNDYLGFADHPTFQSSGTPGATASRLVAGDHPEHRLAEQALATLVGMPDAVLFPSGFQLNVGVLPALIEPGDEVYSDELNHASLIDGLRLARTRPNILPHRSAPPPPESPTWWISESIFSMDGDSADPEALRTFLAQGGLVYLDEAHSLGLFEGGAGFSSHHQFSPTLLMGGLGKAFGLAGAFVASSPTVCAWIRTRARSFVFSTGIARNLAQLVLRALDLLRGPEGAARRTALWSNARRFAELIGAPPPASPIFPIIVGANARALALSRALHERGFHVQAIRPPTVPADTARLRITISASHSPEEIEALAAALRTLL